MHRLLGDESMLFHQALTQPAHRALRLHRFRTEDLEPQRSVHQSAANRAESLFEILPYALSGPMQPVPEGLKRQLGDRVPWHPDAFYIASDSTLGRQVYHEAGAYYIQEPSAMAVVAALDPQPSERILDLAAAPGGKTTAIGRALGGTGLLVANEIHPVRVLTLAQNLERTGIPAVVVNEHPDKLAAQWQHQFDAVLVDAPCSGEGMFRKDPMAIAEWTDETPITCASRQRDILRAAIRMVRPGGRLVYSTCTFNPLENEQIIEWALNEFPVEVVELPLWPGWDRGRPEWANETPELTGTRRLWPHKGRGEGHFVALLRITAEQASGLPVPSTGKVNHKTHTANNWGSKGQSKNPAPPSLTPAQQREWSHWLHTLIDGPLPAEWLNPVLFGQQVFANQADNLDLTGLRVLRPGLALATFSNGRFEPHHSLALAVRPRLVSHTLSVSEDEALTYLSGQTLPPAAQSGWCVVTYEGLALGWGKSVPGRTNNLYPKGLRRIDLRPSPQK